MGIGYFSSEIAPSPLFQAYKTIKQMEKQGKDRSEINKALKEKFADRSMNGSARKPFQGGCPEMETCEKVEMENYYRIKGDKFDV